MPDSFGPWEAFGAFVATLILGVPVLYAVIRLVVRQFIESLIDRVDAASLLASEAKRMADKSREDVSTIHLSRLTDMREIAERYATKDDLTSVVHATFEQINQRLAQLENGVNSINEHLRNDKK